jgi:hypothetical protein
VLAGCCLQPVAACRGIAGVHLVGGAWLSELPRRGGVRGARGKEWLSAGLGCRTKDGARERCGRRESGLREPGRGSWAARREKIKEAGQPGLRWAGSRGKTGPRQGREGERWSGPKRFPGWATGLVWFFLFSFLLSFSNQLKSNLNSNPKHSTKIKLCTSMNAQTSLT